MYLGWALSFEATQDKEIHHRINTAWSKFMVMKQELCCKRYSLKARLKLFDAIITPTILYASGTWTMSAYREMLLRSTQRKMLRKIIGLGRIRPEQAASDEDEETENVDAYDGAEEQDEGNDADEEERSGPDAR